MATITPEQRVTNVLHALRQALERPPHAGQKAELLARYPAAAKASALVQPNGAPVTAPARRLPPARPHATLRQHRRGGASRAYTVLPNPLLPAPARGS